MTRLVPCVEVDPAALSDDDLVLRAALIARYRGDVLGEHTFAQLERSGWWAHEQDLNREAEERGIASLIAVASMQGPERWIAERIECRRTHRQAAYALHSEEHPILDPYRRPYPCASWCYFDRRWHATVADGLGVFRIDDCGNKVWVGEAHLEGVHRPDHPLYQTRRDLIDQARSFARRG